MNCEQARALFSSFIDGEVSPVDQMSLGEHLGTCERCLKELRAIEGALADLKRLARPRPTVPLDQAVATRVRRRVPVWRLRVPAWAAVLLVGVAALLAFSLRSDKAAPEKPLAVRNAEAGYVQVAGHWVPSADAARLREGKTLRDGRWLSEEEVQAEAMRAQGYVLTTEGWERQDDRDALAKGEVRTADGWMPEAELVATLFQKAGLVRLGEGWVEKAEQERLAQGLVRTRDGWKKAEDLAKPAAPAEDVEEVGGAKLSKGLASRIRQGDVLTKDGIVAAKDLAAKLIQAEGFVLFQGKWLPKEVADEIASWSLVKKDEAKSPKNAVTACLDGLHVGDPVKHGLVSLYPLTPKETDAAPAIALDDDVGARIEVKEADNDGTVSNLRVRNLGDRPVLILAGTVLRGGKQDRLPSRDFVAWPGGAWQPVPVYCCESGRWTKEREGFEVSRDLALPSLRRLVYTNKSQARIWEEVNRQIFAVQAKAPTSSLRAAYEDAAYQKLAREYEADLLQGLADAKDATGVALAVGDRLVGAEIYGSPALLRQALPALLHGMALQALAQQRGVIFTGEVPNTKRLVKAALQEVLTAVYTTEDSQARLETLSLTTERGCVGKALAVDGKLAHFVLFSPSEEARRPAAAAPQVGKEKLLELQAEFERMMTYGAKEDKLRAVDVMAGLRIPGSGVVMAKYLADPSADVRIRLAEVLGELRDGTAIAGLVEAIDANRRDPRVLAAVVTALSRVGDERAIEPLGKLLNEADDATADAVLTALPGPVLRCRKAEGIEMGMTKLIAFGESIFIYENPRPKEIEGKARLQRLREPFLSCLEVITGQRFASATEAHVWWAHNKAQFLKDHTK